MATKNRRALTRSDLADQHPDVARVISSAMGDGTNPVDDMLVAISRALCQKRDDARTARQASGIEEIWRRCEDHYEGVDDANRMEWQTARWAKPLAADGPVTTGRQPPASVDNRSRIFIGLTKKYVDSAFAKVAEIILPPDDRAYSFSETPVPELVKALENRSQVLDDSTNPPTPLMRPAAPGEIGQAAQAPAASPGQPAAGAAPPGGPPPLGGAAAPTTATGTPPAGPMQPGVMPGTSPAPPLAGGQQHMVPLTVADLAREKIDMARASAKRAEDQVYTWQVEQKPSFRAESRKMLMDGARLGVGVLKGPVPQIKKEMVVSRDERTGAVRLIYQERVIPA